MKGSISLMAAAALIAFQGCSLEEKVFEPQDPKSEPYKVRIYSDIYQQPASRVTTDGFCTGDEVGVYIVNYNGEAPGTLALKNNLADNARFHYDSNGDWISDYDIFYKDNNTNVDFYGYYPYADPSSIEAYPFEVAKDQSKSAEHGQMASYEASDFLWAKTEKVIPTASKVMLTFRHKMSAARVRFSQGTGWADAEEYAAVSKEVLITNTVRKSKINLATGVVTPEGKAPLDGTIPMNDNGEFRAIVVPQTVAAGKNVLTITIDGSPRQYVRDVATEYLPGKITTYDLSVNKKPNTGTYEVVLTGVNIMAWEADNVSHGDDAREYVVIHNAVAGRLEKTITEALEMDATKIKNLKLTGSINGVDYVFMRDKMTNLQRLNLKGVESICDGVCRIPEGAFRDKKTLIKCVFPDNLERIENYAFSNTALNGTLLLPEGLKFVSGFEGTKINNVHFPSTLEEIGIHAFNRCSSLMIEMKFPGTLKVIGFGAFHDSAISGNLILPDGLKQIGESAFMWCHSLKGSLKIPDQITEINAKTFWGCGFTGTLTLPKGLKKIGESAFCQTTFKGELVLPNSVLVIGNKAFERTLFNGNIILPKELLSLGSEAFYGCSRLEGIVEFPLSLTSVPNNVFGCCSGIEGVKLHKGMEVIEASAFEHCFGICKITSEAKNPPIIDPMAFNGVAKDNFTVEVPEASVNLYKNAANWSEFKRFAAHREFSISRNLFRTLNAKHSKTFIMRAPAGEKWSVESKPDWVTVSPASGTGKVEVSVSTTDLAKGSPNRTGEVVFLLEGKNYRSTMKVEQYDYQYGDGEVITLQTATKGSGVNIVLMGDCFDAKDISEGKYLKAMQDAYGYFFDIEPYLTYKDYFNVYGVFGMSPDNGMGTVNTIREARFGSQYTLNEGVSPDFPTTFAAACLAPIKDDVSTTLIIMLENSEDYSGLCHMWGDGSAVAVVPMSKDPAPYDFRGLIHHEAGGHGFGKLADEYIYHNAFIQSCNCGCCNHVKEITEYQSYGFYGNISLTGSMQEVPWSHMILDPQFSNIVDVYEGAFMHARGVFRSEPKSCMHNNIPYYNAISREAMVKRIKKYAGEPYSNEDFKAKDKASLPAVVTKGEFLWDGGNASSRFGQMPPKFMGEKPSFKKSDFKL